MATNHVKLRFRGFIAKVSERVYVYSISVISRHQMSATSGTKANITQGVDITDKVN